MKKKTRTKTTTQRAASRGRPRTQARKAKRPAPPPTLADPVIEVEPEPVETIAPELELAMAEPERDFVPRVPVLEPDRPFPAARRAIFFDVENTSRAEHIARVIDHLAVDRMGRRTDFIAVGNWKVIGLDTARLLARHGAQLLHSAPSTGVRDWSDLRIAVGAGVWLASARPGDIIEIVTNDRAFDAVGDVAASLGIAFRRLSYQGLVGATAGPAPAPEPARPAVSDARGRHRRRGRRRGWHESAQAPSVAPAPEREVVAPAPEAPTAAVAELPLPEASGNGAEAPVGEPHTAPHDEIIAVVRELIQRAPARAVSIDTLANALKTRGFSRPPGSPRLITRLRRIKEISISRSGTITLLDTPAGLPPAEAPSPIVEDAVEAAVEAEVNGNVAPRPVGEEDFDPDDAIGNLKNSVPSAPPPAPPAHRRRWPRRGGRNRRPRAQNAPAA